MLWEVTNMAGRPLGVTIIAILQLLGALLEIMAAVLVIGVTLLLAPFLMILGLIPLFLGIIGLIVFWGLWTLKGWAWIFALLVNILNILFAIYPTISILSLIFPVIVVIYLLIPSTRAAFKK
jgi:uncharacterized membrane protein (DUF2068 family)